MPRLISGLFLSAALALTLPAVADAFTGKQGSTVNPVNSVVFEVVPRNASNGATFWCDAADYARRALNAPWTAQLYIARGREQSVTTKRKSAVQFTLDPTAAGVTPAGPSLSLNALRVGDSMSVQQAFSYCQVRLGRQ